MKMLTTTCVLLGLFVCGCKDSAPAAAGAPAVQPVPTPVASMAVNDRLPSAVQSAFNKDRSGSTIQRVKHRMNPDGVVHYTITSKDSKGLVSTDEYRADGVRVNPK